MLLAYALKGSVGMFGYCLRVLLGLSQIGSFWLLLSAFCAFLLFSDAVWTFLVLVLRVGVLLCDFFFSTLFNGGWMLG